MHPASRILTYILAALAIPGLPFFMQALLLMAALSLLAGWRRTPLRLLWRTRWLMLMLLLGYGYTLPGTPLLAGFGDYSPTLQGVARGGLHALGLLVLLLWLDILVLALPAERLLGGLWQLFRPLAAVGLAGSRTALRLGLTLKAIEGMERGRGNLIHLLAERPSLELPDRIRIPVTPWRFADYLAPVLVLAFWAVPWLAG